MGFLRDPLSDGRSFKLFNLIDDYNREALGIEIDFSLPSKHVIRASEQIIEWRGRPRIIRCDNGPENISAAIQTWAEQSGIAFQYIQPGKTQQNAYVGRFNRTVRYEWLSQYYWQDLVKSETSPPDGCRNTITIVQTWPWAGSRQNSGRPWPHELYY